MKIRSLMCILMMFVFTLYVPNASASRVQLANDGAYQLHQKISTYGRKVAGIVTKKSEAKNCYIISIGYQRDEFLVNLLSNDAGYVSAITAESFEPEVATNKILNSISPTEYYIKRFDELRILGWGRNAAADEAYRLTLEYHRKLTSDIEKSLVCYGITGNNMFNFIGISLLAYLEGEVEDPVKANIYKNSFASPNSVYIPDRNRLPASKILSRKMTEKLGLVMIPMGLSQSEFSTLLNGFNDNISTVWCASLNRRIWVECVSDFSGKFVRAEIIASDK